MTDNHKIEPAAVSSRSFPFVKVGFGVALVMLFVGVGALGYGYLELTRTLTSQSTQSDQQITAVKTVVTDLQQSGQRAQDLAAQQEKLITDWQSAARGDLEKWYIAESAYLVRLANDNLQFNNNTQMALVLLQRADVILQKISSNNILEIRKAIAVDIASIEAAPKVNVTDIYLRITGLDSQLNQLPLPYSPLKANPVTIPGDYSNLPWWKATWHRTWDSLRKVIIVRNTTTSTMPLVLPDEKPFLYQNMHAQMENVLWALLQHNNKVYQASLLRLINWVSVYFDKDAAETKAMLQHLGELQQINIEPPTMDLSTTLQRFDSYAG